MLPSGSAWGTRGGVEVVFWRASGGAERPGGRSFSVGKGAGWAFVESHSSPRDPAPEAAPWTCPPCGRKLITRNPWHSCTAHTVDEFLAKGGTKPRPHRPRRLVPPSGFFRLEVWRGRSTGKGEARHSSAGQCSWRIGDDAPGGICLQVWKIRRPVAESCHVRRSGLSVRVSTARPKGPPLDGHGGYPFVNPQAKNHMINSSQGIYVRANTRTWPLSAVGNEMALPEPTPPVKGKAAIEFLERLEKRQLSAKQKELFRGARESYERRRAARVDR